MSCVTVLVAVYNAERYLRQCISSLLEQTYSCLQIICIDDASTDGSLELLHDYAKKDSRIVVIEQQQNRGQAHARNVGLRQAVGDYVCFVDSDDWLAPDAIEKTVAVFEQNPLADCVLFTLVKTDENGINPQPYRMKEFESLSGSAAFEASLNWSIHGVYMVRKKLHQAFPYDESQRAYSDDNTTRIHYYNSREVRLSKGIYFYRQHSASTSHQVSVRRFDYILANHGGKVGFYKWTGSALASGKVYLPASELAGARDFIGFDETTGIANINSDAKTLFNGDFFNLAGQRVAQPTKGLYIVNGKKVIIK